VGAFGGGCATLDDFCRDCCGGQGFSEYASYASWVMQHHRDSMYVEPKRTWSRHPAGGWLGMVALRLWHERGLCCPAQWMLKLMRMLGNTFVGFEIGHHLCDATNDKYKEAYGLPPL
jgi:hypothetical protein